MSARRALGGAAAAALLIATVSGVRAETQPAPPGEAEAVAARLSDTVAVARTLAKADGQGGSATANALEIGGKPPSEQFGGTQTGRGTKSGRLLDTGDGAGRPARLQVAPWEASVDDDGTCRNARGRAALARLTLVDGQTAQVDVLQSESDARHCGLESAGKGSSDGAVANLGGGALLLTLLHAEAETSGQGRTFLVGVNDNQVPSGGTGDCAVEVPGIATLTCLTVGGGQGTVFARVADATVAGALPAGLVGTRGAGGSGEAVRGAPGTLPFTGAGLLRQALAAVALVLLGAALLAAARTRDLRRVQRGTALP